MLAPAFRYAHQDLPIAAGELARDQPDPGSKMPSVFELGSVADGRNDRGGRLRADALDGGDAPAWFTFEEYSIYLLVERGDADQGLGRDRKALRLPHAPMPSAHSSYRQGSRERGVALA